MLTRKSLLVLNGLLVLALVLGACTPATPQVIEKEKIVTQEVEKVVTQEVEKVVTQEVEKVVEVTPTPEPTTRTGAWLDQIVFTEQNSAEAAVAQLQAGDLDIYAYTVNDVNVYETVQNDDGLDYFNAYGSYNEVTYNVAEYTDGRLNAFTNPKIREATNMLFDRNYLVDEIYGGLGRPRFTAVSTAFPDYARYAATERELESKYAYNPEAAMEIITTEMEGMGATMGDDGKWQFNGQPVHSLIFLIRTEDERRQIGDYVASQLETVGFTVDRQYKTRTEASPLWVQSDPAEGLWDLYTGGWITEFVQRDEGTNFSFFYTPNDYPIPLFQAYTPTEEFNEIALRLRNNDFASLEERDELFDQALRLSMEESTRVWLVDAAAFTPMRTGLQVAYDLSGGVGAGYAWPYTMRWEGQEGGIVKVAQPGILVEPWNPVAGSNWVYDQMPIRATQGQGVFTDPFTGLSYPERIEHAEVVQKEGLPVTANLDWVDLSFQPEITVPEDAWADWDATTQTFITAGEKFTETQTVNTKITVHYPADMFETVKWHDGSSISVGDFVMGIIQTFDQGKEESAIYDPAAAETLAAFLDHFRGVKIVSTDPLVIETYTDLYALDVEVLFVLNPFVHWYPGNVYPYGPASWHALVPGILAEANGELAFSTVKAEEEQVEWTSFISGPSLEILKTHLDGIVANNTLPYSATLAEFISADEIASRYGNLNTWYTNKGHFWIGTGPFYLDQVFPVEGTLTLRRFQDYPDLANRWSQFGEARVAVVEVEGPGSVTIGDEAIFDAFVTFEGEPYPSADLAAVKYLVFDATGALVNVGDATLAEEGHYTVTLPADVTSQLQAGSNRLEVAVASNVVAIPSFGAFEFVTAP
jgi:peptide/nickel transport system substrate-binding protein